MTCIIVIYMKFLYFNKHFKRYIDLGGDNWQKKTNIYSESCKKYACETNILKTITCSISASTFTSSASPKTAEKSQTKEKNSKIHVLPCLLRNQHIIDIVKSSFRKRMHHNRPGPRIQVQRAVEAGGWGSPMSTRNRKYSTKTSPVRRFP